LSVDTGFDFAHAVAADINVPFSRYDSLVARTEFYDRFVDRLRQTPGVTGVCLINEVPLDRGPGTMTFVPEGETRLRPSLPTTITPACPEVLRIPLIEGRWFIRSEPSPSVVISAALAQALFPDGRSALGRRIHLGLSTGPLLTVVGVSADVRLASLEAGVSPVVWMPHDLGYYPPRRLVAKYGAAGLADPGALRAALRDVDPDLALANVRSMDDIVARSTSSRRFALFLLGGFALTAVVLSAVGIYGVLAHVVGARTQEIGIRVALGARPSMIARLILVQVVAAVAIGAVAGLWGATTMSSTVEALLYGVTARDVSVYLAAGLGVTIIAGLAAWIPTRRALRIDPVVALRNE
jgi:putative ABC transport system permease protein